MFAPYTDRPTLLLGRRGLVHATDFAMHTCTCGEIILEYVLYCMALFSTQYSGWGGPFCFRQRLPAMGFN